MNEDHVTLNNDNVQFALDEILNAATLATHENSSLPQIWVENPVKNSLKIKSNYLLKNAHISISEFSGRNVFTKKSQNIIGSNEIPVSLCNGVYIMTVISGKDKFVKKIVVKN